MENIIAKIEKNTRKVFLSKSVIGNDGENLQEKLVFSFIDEFVNGTARLELNKNNTQSYIMLTKVDNTYELPIRSLITKVGKLDLQLVITEGTNENEIPVFKSNVFFVIVNSSINAEIEEDEEYPQWIDVANTKLNELDGAIEEASNLNIEVSKSGTTTTVTLTDKDGETSSVSILDGAKGDTGSAGSDGITPTIGNNGNWYLGETDTGKPSRGIQGETGQAGSDGADGISPTVTTSKSGTTTTIEITDKNGTHTATINDGINGTNGQDGRDGTDGRDGYVQYTAGNNITIENNVISASGGGEIKFKTISSNFNFDTNETGTYYFDTQAYSLQITYNLSSRSISNFCPISLNYFKNVADVEKPATTETIVAYVWGYYRRATYDMSTGNLMLYKIGFAQNSSDLTYTLIKKYTLKLLDDDMEQYIKTWLTIYRPLTLLSQPTADEHATTKKYVDDLIASVGGSSVDINNTLTSGSGSTPNNYSDLSKGIYFPSRRATYFSMRKDENSTAAGVGNQIVVTKVYIVKALDEIEDLTVQNLVGYFEAYNNYTMANFFYGIYLNANGTMTFSDLTGYYYGFYELTGGAQSIYGVKTFASLPTCSGVPSTNYQLANKKYVDDSIAAAITTTLGGSY